MTAAGAFPRILALISVALAPLACATTARLYPGPPRSRAEVATIEVNRLIVLAVDDAAVETHRSRFDILPGMHAVEVGRDHRSYALCFDARPGHVYLARPVRFEQGGWRPEVIDENSTQVIRTRNTTAGAPNCATAEP